jgi:hypothetical protein
MSNRLFITALLGLPSMIGRVNGGPIEAFILLNGNGIRQSGNLSVPMTATHPANHRRQAQQSGDEQSVGHGYGPHSRPVAARVSRCLQQKKNHQHSGTNRLNHQAKPRDHNFGQHFAPIDIWERLMQQASKFGIYLNANDNQVVRINSPYWLPEEPDWVFLTNEVNATLLNIRSMVQEKGLSKDSGAITWGTIPLKD